MTTMMEWEETSPSPGGSASGSSSLNGHSEAEEETIISNGRSVVTNFITTLNLTINNNNSTSSIFGDKKFNLQNYFPTKENSLQLNDGFNGLNLNPSPPAPNPPVSHGAGGHRSSPSSREFPLPLTRNSSSSSINNLSLKGGSQSLTSTGNTSSSPVIGTPITNSPKSTITPLAKKNKPIPPPLDLSIGASSLNSSSSSSSSTDSATFQYPGNFYSPYYLGSPKFNQAEKSLPLRKRWHSWSPKLMHCSEDLIPLYAESPAGVGGDGRDGIHNSNSRSGKTGGISNSGPTNSHFKNTLHPPQYVADPTPQSAGLQTPTPFYTPNEPSPRFMNSPVFSYSTPDTSLYQGPYSPIRTTSLYPPGSPFLNSNLNTPTFVITNLSPPSTTGISATSPSTVTAGVSPTGSITSSVSSSCTNLTTSNTQGPSPGYGSPTHNSQATPPTSISQSSSNYEEVDLKIKQIPPSPPTPVWNIFLSGTKIRFLSDCSHTTGWYLVDYISQLNDLSLIFGPGLKGEYAPHGLSVKQYVVTSSARDRVQITFSPVSNEQFRHPNIEADCEASHPFVVNKKGICAVKPEGFTSAFGLNCLKLEMLDVCFCVPIKHLTATTNSPPQPVMNSGFTGGRPTITSPLRNGQGGGGFLPMLNSNRPPGIPSHVHHHQPLEDIKPTFAELKQSFHLLETNCGTPYVDDIKPFPLPAIPPSHISPQPTHHIQRLDHPIKQEHFGLHRMDTSESFQPLLTELTSIKKSGTKTKIKKKAKDLVNGISGGVNSPFSGVQANQGEAKGRRPMNAFLVFAKERRPLLIQMYPGKDNRSISTILGDSWKTLDPDEKNFYIKTAKDSAEEQKKLHPDCWKRKRTQQQQQQQQIQQLQQQQQQLQLSTSPHPIKMEVLSNVG